MFALNVADMKDVKIWQPERVLEQYTPQMLIEKFANEMDPNLIIVRLGDSLDKTKLLEELSAPISSVKDQDTFAVSFKRGTFA